MSPVFPRNAPPVRVTDVRTDIRQFIFYELPRFLNTVRTSVKDVRTHFATFFPKKRAQSKGIGTFFREIRNLLNTTKLSGQVLNA